MGNCCPRRKICSFRCQKSVIPSISGVVAMERKHMKTLEIFRPESIRTELLYRVATNYTELTHNVTYQASFGLEIEPAQRKISNHASAIWKDKLFVLVVRMKMALRTKLQSTMYLPLKIQVSTFAFTTSLSRSKNAAAAVWKDKLINWWRK